MFPTLHQRVSNAEQYRHARLVIEMARFNEAIRRDGGSRIKANKISDLDAQRECLRGATHWFIQANLQRGLIPFQPAKLNAMDVSRGFCRHDGAGDLAAPGGGVNRAVLTLDRG